MEVLIGLGLIAAMVAVVTLPGRKHRVTAERFWHALHTLRDGAPAMASREALTTTYGKAHHVRVLQPRGRRPESPLK